MTRHEVGIDLIDVDRIVAVLGRYPDRFRHRILTPSEDRYCRGRPERIAGRWAAKEAVTKALGCGLIQWNGIEVVRLPRQAPTVRITGDKIRRFADMVGVREEDLHISITHSELSAVAVCIVRKEQLSG